MTIDLKNWKTASAGAVAILTAVSDILHSLSTSQPVNWNVDIPAIVGGIGLLFAKDASTHSTAAEVQQSTIKATEEAKK